MVRLRRKDGVVVIMCTTSLCLIRYLLKYCRQRREARELNDLLIALHSLDKKTFLAVTNMHGTHFSGRGLRSYLKLHGLGERPDSMIEQAKKVVNLAEKRRDEIVETSEIALLRHAVIRGAISGKELTARLDQMVQAYIEQTLDYGQNSRYGKDWKISCYLVVMEKWKPNILPHPPMVQCLGDVMEQCVALYEKWYADRFSKNTKASVMNCFLTKYTTKHNQNQLEKHIDGANVDGSVILACPTHDPFVGGALKVWDKPPPLWTTSKSSSTFRRRRQQQQPQKLTEQQLETKADHLNDENAFVYDDLRPGDVIFLDGRLWHQALPITQGTRYALVLFLRLHCTALHCTTHPTTTRTEIKLFPPSTTGEG